jgi:uncharacterized ion transporter superfamily protein YfcC
MWFSAIKMAMSAGSHIYKKRQETKMRMADAQYLHAEKMARGEEAYQGKLLESRDKDYKDEVVLAILTLPILVLAYGVWSDDPAAMDKINLFSSISRHFRHGSQISGFWCVRVYLELKVHKSSETTKNNLCQQRRIIKK